MSEGREHEYFQDDGKHTLSLSLGRTNIFTQSDDYNASNALRRYSQKI